MSAALKFDIHFIARFIVRHDAVNETADARSYITSWYKLFRCTNERSYIRAYFIDADRHGSNTGRTTQPHFTSLPFIHSTCNAQFWAWCFLW